jgi:hypothetical protein
MFFYSVYNLHTNYLYKSGIVLHRPCKSGHHFRVQQQRDGACLLQVTAICKAEKTESANVMVTTITTFIAFLPTICHICEQCGRYSDQTAGRTAEKRHLHCWQIRVQNKRSVFSPKRPASSYFTCKGSSFSSGGESGQSVKLTTRLYLAPRV